MKKISMILPLLAFVLGIAGAFASSNMSFDAPVRFNEHPTLCAVCTDNIDAAADCTIDQPMQNPVRCKCTASIQGTPTAVNAQNTSCQQLWKRQDN